MSTHRGISRTKQAAIARLLRQHRRVADRHISNAIAELDRAAASLQAAKDLEKLVKGTQ